MGQQNGWARSTCARWASSPWTRPDGKVLLFAVNTFRPWSSASTIEFILPIDVNGDGNPDFAVIGIDFGLLTTGAFNGQVAAAVLI